MEKSAPPNIPLWLQYALEELEVSERGKEAENPKILEYFNEVNHPNIEKDETPWCAAFVGAMLQRANLKSTKSLMARSYLKWGHKIKQEKLGSIAILKRGNNKLFGHVGFVISSTKDHIQLLSGNQKNKVSIATFKKDNLLDLRWPNQENEPALNRNFQIALAHILQVEGGWVHHKNDKGGPTFKGITLKTYKRAIRTGLLTSNDKNEITSLKRLTSNQISLIYEELYWKKASCQHFPLSTAIVLFDAAVNHGPLTAVKLLQSAIGAEVDGEVGPETIRLANKQPLKNTVNRFISVRRAHYIRLNQFNIFGKGWLNRLRQTEQLSNKYLSIAASTNEKQTPLNRKVRKNMKTIDDYNERKWWGESLTVWGTIVTALSTILPILSPFIGLDISAELIQQFGDTVAKLIQIIGGITGTSMALYGRARANTNLTRLSMQLKI